MSREKQIEEMAKDVARSINWCKEEYATVDCLGTAASLYGKDYRKQEWISVEERMPNEFVSVLGHMTDSGDFPPVRECYVVGRAFFFPALGDIHPVSHWMPLPEPPKMKGGE